MGSGTGLLLWAAELRHELQPWLAAFLHALAAPSSTLCRISPSAWAENVASVDNSVTMPCDALHGPARKGWKALAMGSRAFDKADQAKEHHHPIARQSMDPGP